METFGEWLHRNRSELRLTREEFAERVGCSVAFLRKIEDGERRPSAQIADLMANSLNIPPAERATFVKVARGELNADRLALSLKPSVTSAPPRTNLPAVPTPLVGRQQEVEELCRLMREPDCRLLTLVGPGGIGKTRLAIETASHLTATFAGGVYFVPLAPLNTARLIVPVIADAIGFGFASASRVDPKTQLFSYLHEKQALLLADNLEQLLAEPGIELLTELLAGAPQVKLLVTSRESLGLQGEWIYEVPGLPIPESSGPAESLPGTSAELFLQRARRAHVGFDVGPEDFSAIARICQLVEGMPLGIELAAAWVRTLSCAEIAQEIERGLGFLSGPARDLPPRHRSMRAVFDHSWALLTGEEQAVLRRLSVFQGGFRREASEQVVGATLSGLAALVTKSMVRRSTAGRYDLHELIRQFTGERLAEHPEEQTEVQALHASYYLTYFGQANARLQSAAQRAALAELTAEMDNFRAAWEWAVANNKFALIDQATWVVTTVHDINGWLQEGLELLDRAIAAFEMSQQHPQANRAEQIFLGQILASRAMLTSRLGQNEQARAMLERSLQVIRPLNEPPVLVGTVTILGNVMEFTGEYDRAAGLYAEGLQIATAIGDRWFAALCRLCQIGVLGIDQPILKPETTRERMQSVVTEWRAVGDPRLTAIALNNLSWIAMALGRYAESRAALEESLALGRSVNDRWVMGFAYRGLGLISQVQGAYQQSVDMYRKSLEILAEIGAHQDVARMLAEMSRGIFALGNDDEAERGWREALAITRETGGTFIALEAVVGLANLRAKKGQVGDALELLLIVVDHPATIQDTRDRARRLCAERETLLTEQQVEAVRARAKEKTFEALVDEIVQQNLDGFGTRP